MSVTRRDRRRRLDPTDGRDLAVLALGRSQAARGYVRDVVNDIAAAARTPPPQLRLGLELAMGVIRHRLTLARLVRSQLTGGWVTLPPAVRHVLLVGAYQLVWLDAVPDYAAVNEAVRQARRAGDPRMAKLVNAVLRNLRRHLVERVAWSADLPGPRAIRYAPEKGVLLDVDLFADRSQDFVTYMSVAASVPTEIVTRWVNFFGRERAESICWTSQWRPPVVLRPNRLRADGRALQQALAAEGIAAEHEPDSDSVFLESAAQVLRSRAFEQGLLQFQDVTAQQPVLAAGLRPGMVVLDLCAGAGTKATQAAECMDNRGRVLAYDVAKPRLELLAANARRLGITVIEDVSGGDLDAFFDEHDIAPDVILVDAPCSNTGVLARRPEAKYRFSPKSVASLRAQQIWLLGRAASLAGPRTRIVYSTCSIEPEENEEVVREFGAKNADWLVADAHRYAPSFPGPLTSWRDGGYWAILAPAAHVG